MIYTGTSGYSYKDWKGPFYPESIEDEEMLEFYAREFSFTEINSTYYSMPNYFVFKNLNEKTPENFVFSVKAHGCFTHSRDGGRDEAAKFMEALKPISENGKLGGLLFQFPYSFHNTGENLEYLKRIRELFSGEKIFSEFRSSEWAVQETMGFLKERSIGWVCVDEPNIRGLVRPVVAVTSDTGYVRFHGRNTQKWYGHKEAYERYDYLYSEEELREWVPRINYIEKHTSVTFVAFNNHFMAQGVENSFMLERLMETGGSQK